MWNSLVPKKSSGRSGRKSLVATAALGTLLTLGFGAGSALGQDSQDTPPPPPQSNGQASPGMGRGMGRRSMETVDDQIKRLTKKLNLSDDQQAKLKPILEDQHKQMEAIHNDSSLSQQDRFSKMQDLRQSSDTQIKSVLNDDQQKNFDKMRAEQQERMKQWRGGGNAPPAGGGPDNPPPPQ
jgi:periplasmic protein CpxP/Spy